MPAAPPISRGTGSRRSGHVTVTILPKANTEPDLRGLSPPSRLSDTAVAVDDSIARDRPSILDGRITATVVPPARCRGDAAETGSRGCSEEVLNPLSGGDDEDGWPLRRNVFISEFSVCSTNCRSRLRDGRRLDLSARTPDQQCRGRSGRYRCETIRTGDGPDGDEQCDGPDILAHWPCEA